MAEIFQKIVSMSISASWLVLAVMVLRLCLKRAPRWLHVLLWGIVAVRLVCPVTPESAFSLMKVEFAQNAAADVMQSVVGQSQSYRDGTQEYNQAVDAGIQPIYDEDGVYYVITGQTPTAAAATVADYGVWIWVAGMAAMGLYTAGSYIGLRRRVADAVRMEQGVYLCDRITSPFVLGFWRPRIYLPWTMDAGDMPHVIAHERTHIRRKDHWWKPLGFALLTIHWFNPLMWVAYVLLCRDIELACDERVIRELGREERADYSQALLKCSINRRSIAACPLAFGEVGVQNRVRNVLNYKKPGFWVMLVAVVVCVVLAVTMLTDPVSNNDAGRTVYLGTVEGVRQSSDGSFLTLKCEDGSIQEFLVWEELELDDSIEGTYVSIRGYYDAETQILTASRVTPSERVLAGDLDEAITQSLLWANRDAHDAGTVQSVGYQIFSKSLDGTTVHLLALHHVYNAVNGVLEEFAGSYMPTALTFGITEAGEYTLARYWIPRDGSYYEGDIRAEFGIHAGEAMSGQRYYDELNRQCYSKALEAYASLQDDTSSSIRFAVPEGDMLESPTLTLFPGGRFQMVFSLYSNYIGNGTYCVEEDRLILSTDEEWFTYTFDIMPGGLIFDGERSSEMVWFSDLKDGTVLEEGGERIVAADPLVMGESYVSDACLYMSNLSSYISWGGDSGCVYTVEEDSFTTTFRRSGYSVGDAHVVGNFRWNWQALPWTEEEFPELYTAIGLVGLNKEVLDVKYQPISDRQYLLNVNGSLLLADGTPGALWSVYRLVPQYSSGMVQWEFEPTSSAGYPGFRLDFEGTCTAVDVSCFAGTLEKFDGAVMTEAGSPVVSWKPGDQIFWCPTDGSGSMAASDVIVFSVWQGEKLAAQGTLYLTSQPNGDLGGRIYTVEIVGQGLRISQASDSCGAVISFTQ